MPNRFLTNFVVDTYKQIQTCTMKHKGPDKLKQPWKGSTNAEDYDLETCQVVVTDIRSQHRTDRRVTNHTSESRDHPICVTDSFQQRWRQFNEEKAFPEPGAVTELACAMNCPRTLLHTTNTAEKPKRKSEIYKLSRGKQETTLCSWSKQSLQDTGSTDERKLAELNFAKADASAHQNTKVNK